MVRRLLPSAVWRRLRQVRRYETAQREDARLRALGHEIEADALKTTQLLAHRGELLRHLPSGAVVAEVGVFEGAFAAEIFSTCQPRELHLVDDWRDGQILSRVETRFAAQIEQGTVQLHRGISWDAMATFPEHYFDWVYIDAGHDFESVRRDLAVAAEKVKPGGYIAGHDYTRWAVQPNGLARFGVVEAVNEFANATGSRLAFLTNQTNRHLSYALKLPD